MLRFNDIFHELKHLFNFAVPILELNAHFGGSKNRLYKPLA